LHEAKRIAEMTDTAAQIYHSAIEAALQAKTAHQALFEANKASYNVFYDAVGALSEAVARENLPEAAEAVRKIETSGTELAGHNDLIAAALKASVIAKTSELAAVSATNSEISLIDHFRYDIKEVDRWRAANVDARDGRMWDVVSSGVGANRREPTRLMNLVVKAWASAHDVKPSDLVAAAAVLRGLNNTYEPVNVDTVLSNYPSGNGFDLVRDMEAARRWTEIDIAAVDAVLDAARQRAPSAMAM
jgi:hypothetical protein